MKTGACAIVGVGLQIMLVMRSIRQNKDALELRYLESTQQTDGTSREGVQIQRLKVMQRLKSHCKTGKGVFQSLQSGNGAGAQWFWQVTQFRQRKRDKAREGAPLQVVCGIAGSPTLRCLSGGPEFCKSCVEVLRLILLETVRKALAAAPEGSASSSRERARENCATVAV